jgi:hypothetical protein
MTEARNELGLDAVPQAIREPLKRMVDHLRPALGGNFAGLTVVGSALTEDYRPGTSDVNTVVLLETHSTAALMAIASMAKPMRKKGISPPLLMTASYIERSRDVFGVEFLDFQLTHATVLGPDPFASLVIAKSDVRLQCERELKATLVRLRQGYVAAGGNNMLVRDVLIAAAKGLAPLLRAMLWLKDIERPRTMEATFRKAAGEFAVDLDAVVTAERWRYEKPRLSDAVMETTFASIYATTDKLATLVDELEVA